MVKQVSHSNKETAGSDPTTKDPAKVSYEINLDDELISTLANAYENRRARQVYEWELLRRNSFNATV